MNVSRFFIDRPIFAVVISLLIFMAGFMALWKLPISEYPDVVPPTVEVGAFYPGANPEVISQTVASPLEQQINGVENMLYMSSQATADGRMGLTVTFKIGTDPDLAQQQVQNRVSQALPRLPDIVRQLGVTTTKSSGDLTMVVHLLSPKERYDMLYLGNYAKLYIEDALRRQKGVGRVMVFGAADYAMRLWLDPQKIAARGLNAADVVNAVREQNVQVAAGVIGGSPAPAGTDLQMSVNAQGRLQTPEEFGEIVVKSSAEGGVTRLKDVARVELGATEYSLRSLLNNKPAIAIGIFQAPGSNALEVSNGIRKAMEQLKKDFPEDVDYDIVYDPTIFVRASISAVVKTLFEAVALVVLVVIVFLQTWRASIIPLLAVPVSIVGTFALMLAFGFSINALTLFGLVLAIGIVVDDAIVVVENVERNIERGLSPRDAAHQAMREVSSPIIAIMLTLIAVFVPIAFISGLTGQFYQQFALTIAISTVISTVNSLTMSPALAALLLKSHDAPPDALTRLINGLFGWFFRGFNYVFRRGSDAYANGTGRVLRFKFLSLLVYALLVFGAYKLFMTVPAGYIPQQDKQFLIAFTQLPAGASLDRTEEVVRRMSEIGMNTPGVAHAVGFPGMAYGFTNAPNTGLVFLTLKPFSERRSKDLSASAIANTLRFQYLSFKDAYSMAIAPPPVMGLGSGEGVKLQIKDLANLGNSELAHVVDAVKGQAFQSQKFSMVHSGYEVNVPQLKIDLDRTRAKQLGIPVTQIFDTLQIYLGSLYINDFNKFGRAYQVIAQADGAYRAKPEDIANLKVRNMAGEMVPLGSVLSVTQSFGPDRVTRYNAYRSAEIEVAPVPGVSSGQAQAAIEDIVKRTLSKGMSFEWTDLTYQQILAGNTALYIFPLCILLVFLVLAAQYESLTLPLAVVLIVPTGAFSALLGIYLHHLNGGSSDNNIFTQIGLMVLAGLACKNAILIVEFARELELEGKSPVAAAIEAARLRLRPILMTSFAFIMGVLPLVYSTGAGAEMRQAIGIAVFSGMLGVTFFGLFLTPVFYVVLRSFAGGKLTSVTKPALGEDGDHV